MSDDRRSLTESAYSPQFSLDGAESHGMIGMSTPMRALFGALPRIASSTSPLLVGGEQGTGKDLIARAVHALSDRAAGPCVTVHCMARPGQQVNVELLEALQAAAGGTVILSGVDGLSIDLQVRLLRALRSDAIDGLGGCRERLDVRIISTASSDLESAVDQGRFCEALHYQLNVVSMVAPPLRQRGRDVQLLADYFLDKFTTRASRRRIVGFSAEARLAMQQWRWPGNVRELLNRIRKAIVMCERGPLYSSDLDLDNRTQGRIAMTLEEARDAAELSALLTALAVSSGDLAIAAARLETSRAAVCQLMQKHRIDVASPQLVVNTNR